MIYNFEEKKQENDFIKKELLPLKEEYYQHQMTAEQIDKLRQTMEEIEMSKKKNRVGKKWLKYAALTAALVIAFIILPNTSGTVAHAMEKIPVIGQLIKVVTFRDYEYESERHHADIRVPEIVLENPSADNSTQEALENSLNEINAEIQGISDEIVRHFENYLKDEEGYQDILVKSEVLTTTEDYFTLKLICYQGAGSGYQWNYYYTIDLRTGERLKLKDLFIENADYITPISNNIKEQMREQMSADENVYYWVDDEIEDWNFKTITEETSFYINENNNLVIGFNEGDVAPMYMGTVEFEIPSNVIRDIRK